MKKCILLIVTFVLLVGLCGCEKKDKVIASLPDYNGKLFYTSGGFQDYTDYAKYLYENVTVQTFTSSKYFRETNLDDVDEMLLNIGNFEDWVDTIGGQLEDKYDFDKSIVTEGDYFYIKTKEGEEISQSPYGKFDNYTVYFFDMDTQILYYFHNNI